MFKIFKVDQLLWYLVDKRNVYSDSIFLIRKSKKYNIVFIMLFVMWNEIKYNRFNFNCDFNSILQDYRVDYRIRIT